MRREEQEIRERRGGEVKKENTYISCPAAPQAFTPGTTLTAVNSKSNAIEMERG